MTVSAERPRRRRRWLGLVLVSEVIVAAVSWWLGSQLTSPAERDANAAPPPPAVVTAPVERRVVTRRVVTRGTVAATSVTSVTARVTAGADVDPVVTQQFKVGGDAVLEGDVVIEVAGRPVFAVQGTSPMYRDITPGVDGSDVERLQAALIRLGHLRGEPTGVFDTRTQRALDALYEAKGYEPLEAVPLVPDGAPEGTQPTSPGPIAPRSEIVFVGALPGLVAGGALTSPADAAGGAVLSIVGSDLRIEVDVDPGDAAEIEIGQRAAVTPAGEAERGAVVVSAQPLTSTGADGIPRHRVVLNADQPLPIALLGADLEVTIEVASTGEAALVVPLTALSSTADGRATVTLRRRGAAERAVAVQPGLSADGWVAITPAEGASIAEGDEVVVTSP